MSTYIGGLGKGLGRIWEDQNWMDHVLMGSALPGAFEYGAGRIVAEHKTAFDLGLKETELGEQAAKDSEIDARNQMNNLLNGYRNNPIEQPKFEFEGMEAPAIPQWTPPPSTTTPTIKGSAPTYKPRRSQTVLTGSKGATIPADKGKKRLLGE